MRSLIFTFGLFAAVVSQAQSFSTGNRFTTLPIEGDLMVTCSDPNLGTRTARFNCQDLRLGPAEYEYFVGPQNQADSVDLQATWANGKQSALKTVKYSNGKSASQVNLWISSLFQRPLLDEGLNKVTYVFKKSDTVISRGDFEVQVVSGPHKQCPSGYITSNTPSDCDNQYTVCDEYFRRYNYCQ